jgi:hypothetical protein
MNLKRLSLAVAALMLFAGCIPSINPFYTDSDLVFEPKLVGSWQTKKTDEQLSQWRFEKSGDREKSYKLTVTEQKTKGGEFAAHFFKLGKESFLDLVPTKCDYASNQADLVGMAMVPGHLLMRVLEVGPELKLATCDYDWLKKFLTENPKSLANHQEGDAIFLTAEPADLQRFVLAHLGEEQLFTKGESMARAEGASEK